MSPSASQMTPNDAGKGTLTHPLQPDVEKSSRLPTSPRREMKDMPTAPEGADFPPLRATLTSMSAREAAVALSNFSHSPHNPQNWPNGKKWRIMLTVALTGFISTCGSSIGVPGIHAAMADFGVTNEKIGVLITSFYVLGLGVGPFVFAPISELYGRQIAYLTSQGIMATLIILRFFCGVCGSAGPALGVATCADVFKPSERGKPISIYAIGPMAGPVLGSMFGYWILFGGWRWLFGVITILAAINYVLLLLFTQETYAPAIEKILQYRVKHPLSDPHTWREKISISRMIHDLGWMKVMVSRDDAKATFGRAFSRPPRLLLTNPVCFIFSAYYAYIYSIIYLFLVCVPLLYGSPPFARDGLFSYGWPQATLSLAYVGLAVGFAMAVIVAANGQDRIYRYLTKRNGVGGQPEYRLVLTQTGMIVMPIGLFIFGWTARAEVHWIAPQIGQAIIAFGLMLAFNSIQNFIVDAFFPFSAAGIACATALRSVTASVLPIFAPTMFTNLGWGWGGSLIALIAIIAIPAPAIMFVWGRGLRERFKFEG